MKKMDEKKLKEDSGFPYGWNKGDTCVMITRMIFPDVQSLEQFQQVQKDGGMEMI